MTIDYPTARQQTAEGNGLTADQLPRFRQHAHPETYAAIHRSWDDCAGSWCTWAGHYNTDDYTKGTRPWAEAKAAEAERYAHEVAKAVDYIAAQQAEHDRLEVQLATYVDVLELPHDDHDVLRVENRIEFLQSHIAQLTRHLGRLQTRGRA